ncbi:MAG: hypothetical protein R3251_00470 [Candidatus Spechtbacterales bacterium]|nr:hypothetical protein [Candidatus Spechtbacterales bacterium]
MSNKLKIVFISCLLSLIAFGVFAQQSQPNIEIISPADDAVFPDGSELTLSYRAENFSFVDFKNNREPFPGNPNAGHAHFWVIPADFEGELNHDAAEKLLDDFRPETFSVDGEGEYKVVIELTQNHHKSFDPPVRDEVNFWVGSGPSAGGEIFSALQGSGPLYKYSALVLLGLLIAYAGFKAYKKFRYKKKVETANEGLPLSDPGGQKTEDTSTVSSIEGESDNNSNSSEN